MPTLDLPACPICLAQDGPSRHIESFDNRSYTWYECPQCGSVLLAVGDRWAYQKIGLASKAHLLKQPLTHQELCTLLSPPPGPVQDAPLFQPAACDAPTLADGDSPPLVADPSPRQGKAWPQHLLVVILVVTMVAFAVGTILVSGRLLRAKGASVAMVLDSTATERPTATPAPPTATSTPRPTATWVPTLTPVSNTPTVSPLSTRLAGFDTVEKEVVAIRDLIEIYPLTHTLMGRRELPAYLAARFGREHPAAQLADGVQVLSAFDYVPPHYDLRSALWAIYSTQAVGFYDPVEDDLLIMTDLSDGEFDLFAQLAFVHEYSYGLLDQHFDLAAFLDETRFNSDELLAHRTLVEGDVTMVMAEYLKNPDITEKEMWDLTARDLFGDRRVLAASPQFLFRTLEFPSLYGTQLVASLRQDGWEAVDAAYADPPQSTEQLLHMERYLWTRDEPQMVSLPPLTGTLVAGWTLVENDTLGEFRLRLFLGQQLDLETTQAAADGWDGNRYALYARDGDNLLVWSTVWDDAEECVEFVAAYQQYAETKYGHPPTDSDKATARWDTPYQTAILAWDDTRALVIVAPDAETAQGVLRALRQKAVG
jgi:hypothetical protein